MGESDYGGGMDGMGGMDYSGDASLAGDPADAGSFGSGLDGMGYGGDLMGPEPGFFSYDEGGYGLGQMSNDVSASYSDAGMANYAGEDTTSPFMDFFTKNPLGRLAQMAIGRANPFAGQVVGMGRMAGSLANNNSRGNALGSMGGMALGALGSVFGGPAGGMIGGAIGNSIGQSMGGNTPGYSGPSMGQAPGAQGGGMDFGTGMGLGLASLYQNSQNSKGINQQLGTLQNMYGQKSPYAQQLRQALERRDAAGGRRSQYGPREVELQAALANAYSRNAPAMNQLQQMRMGQRNQNLAQLAGLYQQMGGMGGMQRGLQGLYSDIGGMFTGMNQYDNTGIGIGDMTADFNDVLPDVWGG